MVVRSGHPEAFAADINDVTAVQLPTTTASPLTATSPTAMAGLASPPDSMTPASLRNWPSRIMSSRIGTSLIAASSVVRGGPAPRDSRLLACASQRRRSCCSRGDTRRPVPVLLHGKAFAYYGGAVGIGVDVDDETDWG